MPDTISVEANPMSFFGDESFELTPGVIDEDAEYVFTHGQCHALALALNERTGWPLVGIAAGGPHHPSHCAVRRPDGEIIDITGYAERAVPWIFYGPEAWYPVDAKTARAGFPVSEDDPEVQDFEAMWGDEFPDEIPDTYYRLPDLPAGRLFVDAVLKRTGSVARDQRPMFEVVGRGLVDTR